MSEKYYWYGHLDAGSKSSPVLLDKRLDTGKADTLYLFNLNRGEILEYKRTIIAPKLRELGQQDRKLNKMLKTAYIEARQRFIPRGSTPAPTPLPARKTPLAANDAHLGVNELETFSLTDISDEGWAEEEA
jgi:hypothetical protein